MSPKKTDAPEADEKDPILAEGGALGSGGEAGGPGTGSGRWLSLCGEKLRGAALSSRGRGRHVPAPHLRGSDSNGFLPAHGNGGRPPGPRLRRPVPVSEGGAARQGCHM